MTDLQLRAVNGPQDLSLFIRLPNHLHRDLPHFTPQLDSIVRGLVDPRRSPFMRENPAQAWLAFAGERPVGRIMAIENRAHLARHQDGVGHFGFLDGTDDPVLFARLLETAAQWLRNRGLGRIEGPFNPSINYDVGLLMGGLTERAKVNMSQAPLYYAEAIEAAGFSKVIDLFSFRCDTGQLTLPGQLQSLIGRVEGAGALRLRPMRMARFREEVELLIDIYNDGWASNWSAVPMTIAEARALADELRPLIQSWWIHFVELEGRPVAAALHVPDLNEAASDLQGRLFPLGWMRLLWRMRRPSVRSGRLLLLGVRKSLHGSSLSLIAALMLVSQSLSLARQKGVTSAEVGWILETNRPMLAIIERLQLRSKKTYRVFGKQLQ